jgi:hypothetical protein
MTDVPEIAPEIRGLLEEIVADPRSSLRLAPRRALRAWFDGQAIRPREASGTKLERHLVEVHREALADLLREAAMIAYWKAPILTHKPVGPDGKLYDPAALEPGWQERTEVHVRLAPHRDSAVDLLAGCLRGLSADQAHALATASLSLVGDDRTRLYLAKTVAWDKPRVALSMLTRFQGRKPARGLADQALLLIGARLCALELLDEARRVYTRAARCESVAVYGRTYSFNLSCLLGDDEQAIEEARELEHLTRFDDEVLLDERSLLRVWWAARPGLELAAARATLARISRRISQAASVVSEAFQP